MIEIREELKTMACDLNKTAKSVGLDMNLNETTQKV